MADRRFAEGAPSARSAGARGTGSAGPAERSGTTTVGVYDRPAWWQTRKGAITIAAVAATTLLSLFFYLAAG